MKIFCENNAQAQDKIYIDKEVKKIIQHLNQTDRIIGDDDLIVDELEQAKNILEDLLVAILDKNTQLIYFSGSSDEFMKRENRVKKENIEVLCDNEEDMEAMIDIMDLASQVVSKQHQSDEYATGLQVRRKMTF